MTKRKKITLTLAAILVAIAGGAQVYTNHKVDQVLQKFPYSLDTQAMLSVTESNKNFFSRELIFKVQDSSIQSTEIISTKLTTLPFFITAESQLSDQFVRQLNKTLNITIDKNTINSKFSPVGDYLQSNILTEFRDFANKPQQIEIALNLLNNNEVELKANLSGFHYDNDSKLEKVEGKARLVPIHHNQYEITNIEVTAENAELALLNGENTHLQLKNTTYKFNTKRDENTAKRDLMTKFSSDILRISNKNRTTKENQTTFGGLNLFLTQQGVPSAVNFYNEFKKLNANNQNIKDGVHLLTAILTKNDYFDGKLSVLSVNAPKNQKPYFNLKEGEVALKLINTDLTKANLHFQFNVENVKQTPEDENQKWEAKKGKLAIQLNDYNLANELAFVPLFLETLTMKAPPQKDNKDLLNLKEKWAKEFSGNTNIDFSLDSFNLAAFTLDQLTFSDKNESLEKDQYNQNITLDVKKIALPDNQAQLESFRFSLPLKGNYRQSSLSSTFCSGYHTVLCAAYLTKETQEKYAANKWKDLDLIVDNAKLAFHLNTLPETKGYPINLELNGIISKTPEDQSPTNTQESFTLLQNSEGTLEISLDKKLIDDPNEKTAQIRKSSGLWTFLKDNIKPQGNLLPFFAEEENNYILKIEKNENTYQINGRTLEDIQQESLMKQENEPQIKISE
ncbi:hypothetical protein [Rodentibacter myodis]|uniref:DUF945 domain-containing protein n=1 Tax=Rodentibacter myodis TaxID=1907939 RepID=A0A1V3JUS4_9PAST|nr:hypothetical protein [Rodentibacter myodis]OOF60203.1 hypothetical protein BKL49_00480 [Rodentibacter myodis]